MQAADLTDGIVLHLDRIAAADRSESIQVQIAARAQSAMRQPLPSVTHKPAAPPGGSLHDYWSIGPYWWPNESQPNELPYVRRDGQVNPEHGSDRFDRTRLDSFVRATMDLSLAAMVLKHQTFADRAILMLRSWFVDPATRMNPNLQFGQSIPGVCEGRGIGLIDTQSLISLLDATLMLRRIGTIDLNVLERLQQWFGEFLDWMLTHPYGLAERREHNNHGTWFDAQAAAFALFAGRPEVASEIIASVPQDRLDAHIAPDGSQPHELTRTRSLTYSCFNLRGLFALTWMGRHVGKDLWSYESPDGRSLRRAMDFLATYADANTSWPYPELPAEAHLSSPRQPLADVLRQAARAWTDPQYAELAKRCDPVDSTAAQLYEWGE